MENTKQVIKLEPPAWDSGSTLYDSFELHSFNRHLDSAIASRSFSLHHYSSAAAWPQAPPQKPSKRISVSVRKFLRSVFAAKSGEPAPESPEIQNRRPSVDGGGRIWRRNLRPEDTQRGRGGDLPELGSFVRRTASERFTAASVVGVYCS